MSARKYIDFSQLQEYLGKQNIQLVRFQESSSLSSQHDLRTLKSKREKNPDPVPTKTTRPSVMGITLQDQEVQYALEENLVDFPKVEKYWVDPTYRNQQMTLVSFVPSKGATPDEDGVFGMFKVRGTFSDEKELMDRAEYLIREVDSYHVMYQGEVGRALPITIDNRKYAEQTSSVDVREKAIEVVDNFIKSKKRDEERSMQEQQDRQRELVNSVNADPDSDESLLEHYTTINIKKANIVYSIVEALKQLRRYRDALKNAMGVLGEMEQKNPEFKQQYLDRYRKACDASGITPESNPLMKYLVADGLPFDLNKELAFDTQIEDDGFNANVDIRGSMLPPINREEKKSDLPNITENEWAEREVLVATEEQEHKLKCENGVCNLDDDGECCEYVSGNAEPDTAVFDNAQMTFAERQKQLEEDDRKREEFQKSSSKDQ